MKMSEREQYLSDNPHLQQTFTSAPGLGDPMRLGRMKPDNAFRDILKKVGKDHPRSNVNSF